MPQHGTPHVDESFSASIAPKAAQAPAKSPTGTPDVESKWANFLDGFSKVVSAPGISGALIAGGADLLTPSFRKGLGANLAHAIGVGGRSIQASQGRAEEQRRQDVKESQATRGLDLTERGQDLKNVVYGPPFKDVRGRWVQRSNKGEIKEFNETDLFSEPFPGPGGVLLKKNLLTNETFTLDQPDSATSRRLDRLTKESREAQLITIGRWTGVKPTFPDLNAAGVPIPREKDVSGLIELESKIKGTFSLIGDIRSQLIKDKDVITAGGTMSKFIFNMKSDILGLTRFLGVEAPDFLAEEARFAGVFERLGIESAVTKSLILDLAYMTAIASGQTGRSLSDRDVENFARIVGSGISDPLQLTNVLSTLEKRFARNYNNLANGLLNNKAIDIEVSVARITLKRVLLGLDTVESLRSISKGGLVAREIKKLKDQLQDGTLSIDDL